MSIVVSDLILGGYHYGIDRTKAFGESALCFWSWSCSSSAALVAEAARAGYKDEDEE